MTIRSSKIIIPIVVVVLMSIAILGGIHFVAVNGDAYKSAVTSLRENKVVESQLGKVVDAGLGIFAHYMVRQVGGDGYAEYEIHLTGEKGEGKVWVQMERQSGGVWELKKGNLFLSDTDQYKPIAIIDQK